MRIALVQQPATEDREQNRRRGLDAVGDAARKGAQVICFSELAFEPFYPQEPARRSTLDLAEPIPGPTTEIFASRARELGVVLVLNLFERAESRTYDASPVIDADGRLLGTTRMVHITDYAFFHERGYYSPGDHGAPVYETAFGRIGVAICYDRHYPEYMRALAVAGAQVVVVPQAGAVDEWPDGLFEAEMRVAAFQNGYYTALCNRVGPEPKVNFAGESFVCDPNGNVIARAGKETEETLVCDLDLSLSGESHARRLFLRDRRPELYGGWLGKRTSVSVYQSKSNPAPDSEFAPGDLRHLVAGNKGRVLDARRTPCSVAEVRPAVGTFVLRIDDFEDEGARWEVPFENVHHYQFALGQRELAETETAPFREAMKRFDRPFSIPCDPGSRAQTVARLARERETAAEWIAARSVFFAENGELPSPVTREGDPRLYRDLREFMTERGLWDMENAFAAQFVSNPGSGELVKGHQIVIAELGLVPFEGKVIRDPELFSGNWDRERRADHVLARLGFVFSILRRTGRQQVSLYRGVSTEEPLKPPRNHTFVSASFSEEVAWSHFVSGTEDATRALVHQAVPVERVFMTYLETEHMNRQFKEAEAVLFYDEDSTTF